ncbi:MAG TPA: hypothetical protein VNZ54_07270 [bacterium]|nr:hypothetical protein [bacterium]
MDSDAPLPERMRGLVERLAVELRWQDLRRAGDEEPLRGYLTRGAGPEAPWEFRFAAAVPGLEPGAVLRLASSQERWRVTAVGPVALDGQALAWGAKVQRLGPPSAPPPPPDLDGLLAAAEVLLARSTLAPWRPRTWTRPSGACAPWRPGRWSPAPRNAWRCACGSCGTVSKPAPKPATPPAA